MRHDVTWARSISVSTSTPSLPPDFDRACQLCDDASTCGKEGLYLTARFTADLMAEHGRGVGTGVAYMAQFQRLFFRQRSLLASQGLRANQVLVPLCAPHELAGATRMNLLVIVTSEVRTPTLRIIEE